MKKAKEITIEKSKLKMGPKIRTVVGGNFYLADISQNEAENFVKYEI